MFLLCPVIPSAAPSAAWSDADPQHPSGAAEAPEELQELIITLILGSPIEVTAFLSDKRRLGHCSHKHTQHRLVPALQGE